MNPTPEQVAQWAREAGCAEFAGEAIMTMDCLSRFATLACAWQAEQDAVTAEQIGNHFYPMVCAAAIRANAPKGTM